MKFLAALLYRGPSANEMGREMGLAYTCAGIIRKRRRFFIGPAYNFMVLPLN